MNQTVMNPEDVGKFLCTGTAVLEFNYEGEARESFRTPSFWKQKRRAARFLKKNLCYVVVR